MLINKRDKCRSPAKVIIKYSRRNQVLVEDIVNVSCGQTHTSAL